jgi:hypothetical protein
MPSGELYINDQDAYTTWGVSFEDGALASLMTPPSMKDTIVNESRLEHGKRRMNLIPRMQERELTLPFHLVAANKTQYLQRYAAFVNELTENEYIDIRTSYQVGVTYRCIYVSCSQFSQFIDGLAKFTLKVIEPNPYER